MTTAIQLLLGELDQVCGAPPSGAPCQTCGHASIMHTFKQLRVIDQLELQRMKTLATEATNALACVARATYHHKEVARLHKAIKESDTV